VGRGDARRPRPGQGVPRRARAAACACGAGVSLELEAGRTFGIVGESGCGKSTLARLLVGLQPPSAGSIESEGVPLLAGSIRARRSLARRIQLVFQDPFSSLDPRLPVERALGEVLKVHGQSA